MIRRTDEDDGSKPSERKRVVRPRADHHGIRIAGRSFVAAAMLSLCPPVLSETLDVPGSYLTIQQAIDAAEPGDEVHVAPGRYYESIDFKGKGIRVFGTEGPELTILDGTEVDSSLVRCVSGEDRTTVLEGFRIVSGSGDPTFYGEEATVGGGMVVMNASPPRRCIFEGNNAATTAGDLQRRRLRRGSARRFESNSAEKGAASSTSSSHHRLRLRVECRPLRRRRHLQRQQSAR